MGGAASKDFLENGPKNAVAKELDELGGYDRPALAKNQSFTARLDWLGNQVVKTSDQMEAALSKDEQAGRKELEKEAKRRQLMALRRGQGDVQMNLQYADFYLRQKMNERGTFNNSASILRNSHIAALATEAVEISEASSAKLDAARRTAEQVATLQRLYSSKSGPGAVSQRAKPSPDSMAGAAEGSGAAKGSGAAAASGGGNTKWRQTVQHAKKTAFLAVGTYVAMNQLGEGVQKFVEEGERLAAARDKLPDMKAELENLRSAMQQLAAEQQALEASCPPEALDSHDGDGDGDAAAVAAAAAAAGVSSDAEAAALDDDGLDADEAAATAAAAMAAMRHPGHKASSPNKPRWHYSGASPGFDSAGYPRAKPGTRLRDAPASAPPGRRNSNSAGGSLSLQSAPLASALPTVGYLGPPPAFSAARRRATTPSSASGAAAAAAATPLLANGSPPLQGGGGGAGLTPRGRTSLARASWSGAFSQPDPPATPGGGGSGGGSTSAGELLLPLSGQQTHGAPLRPSRPSAPGSLRLSAPSGTGVRCRSEPVPAATAAAAAAAAGGAGGGGGAGGLLRPASPVRPSLLGMGPRPPSCGGSPVLAGRPGPPGPQRASDTYRPVLGNEAPSTPGEHRVGTMAQRIASKIALPLRAARHQLRSLRDAETANVLRQQQLLASIEENAAILQSTSGMLNMYCNRANGRWVEAQQWAMPPVHEAALPGLRQQAARYKDVVLRDIKDGRLAVQIHVDDDIFMSARLGPLAMWSVDPWQLLAVTHPTRTEWTSHLVGLGLGVRQLLALATAVESLAGTEAVGKMQVVLSCHEGQVEAVVRDLTARKMCRFSPDNVIISVQQRAPGHAYDKVKRTFAPAPQAPPRAAGSGYALLALCWAGSEAFRLGGADLSERRPLDRSALDTFLEKEVTWLSSWRLRDLVHYSPENCLNIEQLALSYALSDSMDANMSMQVELIESLHGISRYGSGIVLSLKERALSAVPPPAPAAVAANVPLLRRTNGRTGPHGSGPATSSTSATSSSYAATSSSSSAPSTSSTSTSSSASTSVDSAHTALTGPSTPPLAQPQPPSQPPSVQAPLRPLHIPPQRQPLSAPPSPPLTGAPKSGSPRCSLDKSGSGGSAAGGGGGRGGASSSRRSLASSGSAGRAGGIGGEGGPLSVCDIKWADVQTPALAAGLQQLVDTAAQQNGTTPRVPVSIKRYMYHVPSLRAVLSGPSIFRPSVSIGEGGYLYVTFDASDITAQPAARCVALSFGSRGSATTGPGGAAAGNTGNTGIDGGSLPPARLSSAGGAGAGSGATASAAASAAGAASPAGAGNNSLTLATAQSAQSALQRGRLLTNDSDLDTLLWVMGEQDNHPGFRASVSATNTARSRVVSHAGAGVVGGSVLGGPGRGPLQQRVIVVAVTDDAACPLAVRVAMAVMKPGADCLHVLSIAKDPSSMAVSAARGVAEKFESMAAATLGDVKSVVQVKRQSIVEDIAAYAELVRASLLVTGSMSLAAAQGSSVVGSVALSLARDCNRPILVVKPNARQAESAYEVGKKLCLRAAVPAETGSRPMVRFVVDHVLDGTRGDKLVLIRGKAFDKDMQELTSRFRSAGVPCPLS
ncbi:hypothetical protein VOLCADRAFT_117970 [Volvox carteri f. nagariensis]|uniref:UspA domain-containing protein n=1 Tax=Volvox carteri f. nagariensis TaxID=3068 RepID=D8TZK1_VOLCA|nr:uncharacterized protein VOLCADRAFT_117970 [Volvox carteri f. nagariensis]EFJ47027.1 hypothetical protein VOLCADRAFT_117970 [Volvox carteri f. nagariensis]|eukprot:XP_002951922.1 hypothetical protein VOLCADRAFT_117970 [Volvox carteri f. nagariensis]